MTDTMMQLQSLLEKAPDADVVREGLERLDLLPRLRSIIPPMT